MKIFTRSEILKEILKENNKYFIQVTIINNENSTTENNIIYGKLKKKLLINMKNEEM